MGLFGLGKKAVAAELAGRNITAMMIDADECWKDACSLRSYKTTGPIATCEVAFAKGALVKSILARSCSTTISDRALTSADQLINEAFEGEDTDDTRDFFGKPLAEAAKDRVAIYFDNVFPVSQLAATLGTQLGVPGLPSIEAAHIFERVERLTAEMLKKVKLI